MTSVCRMSADDERAISIAVGGMVRKGVVTGEITKDDLRQEMVIRLLTAPNAADMPMPLRVTVARRAGIDYVRQIRSREGTARNLALRSMVRPEDEEDHDRLLDSQQSGDDPALWAEVAEQIERAMAPRQAQQQPPPPPPADPRPPARRIGAPDPRSLATVIGPPPSVIPPPRSAWAAVFESIPAGGAACKVMTREQAEALASWARAHKVKVIRRRLQGEHAGMYGVWRVA
jgi:hypothetical protein